METVGAYKLDAIEFSKPKKYNDYLVSKVKYNFEDETSFIIQFPKMIISNEPDEKNISLEFKSSKGTDKDLYNFLSKLDTYILNHVSDNSEEWFGKKIPYESIKKMYNSFIKAPQTSEHRCSLQFSFKTQKNELKTVFVDKKDNEIDFSQFKKNEIVEAIAQFKYVIFSKDTCFCTWEISSLKIHKKTQRVKKYGFIEDPDDREIQSDSDDDISVDHFF